MGLTNPLYPYYTPAIHTNNLNNTQVMHSTSNLTNQPKTLNNDFDLLKEYGLDFNSLNFQKQEQLQHQQNVTGAQQSSSHMQGQASWTKFND